MTPSDAQLAEIEALIGAERGPFLPGSIYRHMTDLIAALRDARAENERLLALVPHVRRGYEASEGLRRDCLAQLDAARRELAALRARIETACDETRNWHVYPTRDAGDCFGFDTVNDFVVDLRAALSPAETEPK